MGGAWHEDFLNRKFKNFINQQRCGCCNTYIPDGGLKAGTAGKKSFFPGLPEVGNYGEHGSRVEHHEQKGHSRA